MAAACPNVRFKLAELADPQRRGNPDRRRSPDIQRSCITEKRELFEYDDPMLITLLSMGCVRREPRSTQQGLGRAWTR